MSEYIYIGVGHKGDRTVRFYNPHFSKSKRDRNTGIISILLIGETALSTSDRSTDVLETHVVAQEYSFLFLYNESQFPIFPTSIGMCCLFIVRLGLDWKRLTTIGYI